MSSAAHWHPHPDRRLEALIASAAPADLERLLRHPKVATDRYAHLRVIDRLHALRPDDATVLNRWVQAMLLSNRPAQVWTEANGWACDASSPPGLILLAAQVAQTMGETAAARARYRYLVEQHPTLVDGWQKYLDFEDSELLHAADIRRVHAFLNDAAVPYGQEKAAFALAGHYNRGSPGRAFLLACEAQRLKRERLGAWDPGPLAARLKLDQLRVPLPVSDDARARPVFVVALPRSGTTLLTGLLDSHSQISGLGEQHLIPSLAQTAHGDHPNADPRLPGFVQAWYRAATGDLADGARVIVDKLPANIEHIGLILAMFPDALVVHLERQLADCAMSIHLCDFEFGCRYGDDAAHIRRYAELVGDHAQYWRSTVPERVLSVHYELLVQDPRSALAPLMAAVGLSWEEEMLAFWRHREQTATFSESQMRQPVHRNSVGGWRRFLPEAADYIRALGIEP